MFRCCSLETSRPRLLPQSLKDCSINLCLFFWWGGRREGGSGWGRHVNPRPFHFNVWQNSLQIKKNKKIKKEWKHSIRNLHVCVCVSAHVLSRVWLCDLINCSLSRSSGCGISQARNMGCYKSSDQKEIYYKEVNNYKEVRQAGARGPLLQCFHLDKHLEQQNTPCILYWCKLSEPKNSCLHAQLG